MTVPVELFWPKMHEFASCMNVLKFYNLFPIGPTTFTNFGNSKLFFRFFFKFLRRWMLRKVKIIHKYPETSHSKAGIIFGKLICCNLPKFAQICHIFLADFENFLETFVKEMREN